MNSGVQIVALGDRPSEGRYARLARGLLESTG